MSDNTTPMASCPIDVATLEAAVEDKLNAAMPCTGAHLARIAVEEVLRTLNTPAAQPIDTAQTGDGWILGLINDEGAPDDEPWAILTRCDGGWCDVDGYGRRPTSWARLPNPQPKPTGWRAPEGVVEITPVVEANVLSARWWISIMLPDGTVDKTHEGDFASTLDEARQRASKMSAKLGLTIKELGPQSIRLAYSGVPITEGNA